jgi:hypothetical protein
MRKKKISLTSRNVATVGKKAKVGGGIFAKLPIPKLRGKPKKH